MTGTSRALRRLGVAGLSAVLMTTGLAAFAATAANAATVNSQATSIDIQPPGDAATVNTCNPFTATVSPAPGAGNNYTVTVVLSQQNNTAVQTPPSTTIGFCDVTGFTPGTSYPNAKAGPDAPSQAPPPVCPTGPNVSPPSPAAATTSTCQGTFVTDAGTNPAPNTGKVTFGVTSNTPGSMSIQAYVDKNQNGVFDNGIDVTKTVTKTWNANTAGSITCSPTTQSKAASPGATATVTCSVTTGAAGAGTPATGQDVKYHITAGPDADPAGSLGHQCNEVANPTAQPQNAGQYTCTVTNGAGITGTDDITAWVDVDHNGGIGTTEPTATPVHVVWLTPAPNGATNSVTCDKNVVATSTAGGNTSSVCQDPLSDKSVKFTASVKSGVNSTNPVVGTLVSWQITGNNAGLNEPASDTETITGDNGAAAGQTAQCTTGADGSCFVTLSNGTPTEGENITVTATVKTANGASSVATGKKQWHNPTPQEVRNVTVSPAHASQVPGGAQSFTATATDRFANPVSGACIGWMESGPGRLNNVQQFNCSDPSGNQWDTTCLTGANGQCTIEVTSLSTESGTETVTASIQTTNGCASSSSSNCAPSGTFECQAAAGYSYYTDAAAPGVYNPGGTTPNANGANNVATGAPAGNCTANGTVNWTKTTPPPTTHRQSVNVKLSCFSRHKHRVTCVAQLSKAIAGVTVIFRDAHGNRVGSDVTGSAGKARLHLHGLRSGSRHKYQAHAKRSSKTFAADSRFARVTVL